MAQDLPPWVYESHLDMYEPGRPADVGFEVIRANTQPVIVEPHPGLVRIANAGKTLHDIFYPP